MDFRSLSFSTAHPEKAQSEVSVALSCQLLYTLPSSAVFNWSFSLSEGAVMQETA